jgi:ribonuclease P protein component
VILFGLRSGGESIRLGVSASGKAGSHVVRNRLKRILREAARREAQVLGPGYDVVLIAKASAAGQGLWDIAGDVRSLFSRLELNRAGQGGAGEAC